MAMITILDLNSTDSELLELTPEQKSSVMGGIAWMAVIGAVAGVVYLGEKAWQLHTHDFGGWQKRVFDWM
jgi:hypothetical protein